MWEFVNKTKSVRDIYYTERLEVHGGWLVRTFYNCYGGACAMTFVPDPNHEWKLKD